MTQQAHKSRVQGPGPLQIERVDKRFGRKLLRELVVKVEVAGGATVKVPKGTCTNYSTQPPGTRWIVHWSKIDVAGVVHDYLYSPAGRQNGPSSSRKEDDDIWWQLATSGGWSANAVQAWLGWLALRGCGWAFRQGAPEFSPGWFALLIVVAAIIFGSPIALICTVLDCLPWREGLGLLVLLVIVLLCAEFYLSHRS